MVGGLFLALVTVAPAAMGRGDAKLAFTLGIALGYLSWAAVLVGLFAGFLAGSLVGLAARDPAGGLRSAIPFGPALLLGCWLVLAVPPVTALGSARSCAASVATVALTVRKYSLDGRHEHQHDGGDREERRRSSRWWSTVAEL